MDKISGNTVILLEINLIFLAQKALYIFSVF